MHVRAHIGNTHPALLLARPGNMGLQQHHLYELPDLATPWQTIQLQSIVFLEWSTGICYI